MMRKCNRVAPSSPRSPVSAGLTSLLVASVLVPSGCTADEDGPRKHGSLTIVMHDAPIEGLTELRIRPQLVRVRDAASGEWTEIATQVEEVDVLSLVGGLSVDLIVDEPLPTGTYDQLRIVLQDDPTAVRHGELEAVDAPSATSSGMKVRGEFAVAAGGCMELEVDFDAKNSLDLRTRGLRLNPVIDIVSAAPCALTNLDCPATQPDCDRCIPDVLEAFGRERTHGYPLRLPRGDAQSPIGGTDSHYQGIVRVGNDVFVSRSGEGISFDAFHLGSRDADDIFYSNAMGPEFMLSSLPPPEDTFLFEMPYTPTDPNPGNGHSGGMDTEGCLIAVPMESNAFASVAFYDVCSATEDPDSVPRVWTFTETESHQAGTVALATLPDGHFVMVIGRKHAATLDFFISNGSDFHDPDFDFDLVGSWHKDNVISELPDGDTNFPRYQSLTAVTQCDGSLYLVGMHKSSWISREDWADLYRVDLFGGTEVNIYKSSKKHFWCEWNGVHQCNFQAGGGTWVSPDRELVFYGVEHANDGAGKTVKVGEFGPDIPIARSECPTRESSWIEVFVDHGFKSEALFVDWPNRGLEPLHNLDAAEKLEDRISSVRFCGAPGVRALLYEHKEPCSGDFLEFVGSGTVEEVHNLADSNFGDKASCLRLMEN